MKIRAQQKNSRQSPRKVRLIANQVKDLPLDQAFIQLSLMERKGALVILKVLRQAVANAVNNHQLDIKDLEIDQILVKTGPTYKRMRPVSRGRAHRILKRTSHVEVILRTKQAIDKIAEVRTGAKKQQTKPVDKIRTTQTKKTTKKQVKKIQSRVKSQKDIQKQKIKDESKIKGQVVRDPATAKLHRRKASSSR
jgi:large subunit ribosomal protein L22